MPESLIGTVVTALVTALATMGAVVLTLARYTRKNGNPGHGACRWSQTAVGEELEPLRNSLKAIELNQVKILTKLGLGE